MNKNMNKRASGSNKLAALLTHSRRLCGGHSPHQMRLPADAVRIDHRNGSSSNVHRQAKACLGKRLSCPELFLQLMLWIPARAGEKAARARERETVSEAGGETDGGW